ncbi:MAG: amidohydrolase [Deltaproteobacteria bacterium]|nr:amidohydrolase [Deltaproteobacteria bacterium]
MRLPGWVTSGVLGLLLIGSALDALVTRHAQAAALDLAPDLILHNGKIVTVDRTFSIARAVAIKDGRFVAVGDDQEVLALAGPGTTRRDLQGRTVIPGLIDSHNHMDGTGVTFIKPNPVGSRSIADIQRLIADTAAKIPPGQWIVTARVSTPTISLLLREKRFPTRQELDAAAPRHPVALLATHALVLNSEGLRRVGIDKTTPHPKGGEVGVDPGTGEPDGRFYERPAMMLVEPKLPPYVTYEDYLKAYAEAQRRYHAVGLTGVIIHGADWDSIRALRALRDRGELTIRTYVHWRWGEDLNALSRETLERTIRSLSAISGAGLGDEWLKVAGIKVTLDGGVSIGTALTRTPYRTVSGHESHGIQLITTEKFRELAELCARYGLRLAVHDSGDRAMDVVFGVYEEVNRRHPLQPLRFVAVHAQIPDAGHMRQVKALGLAVPTQPIFLYRLSEGYVKYLGKELAERAFPIRSWLDQGVRVGLGSDSPVNTYDPIQGIAFAATRRTAAGQVMGAKEAISVEEALRGYTINNAWIAMQETLRGSIEPGKLADLVVLSEDLLTVPKERIKDIKVLLTMVGGKIVYEAR